MRMLDKNPNSRIKMHEIMQNKWLFPQRAIFQDSSLISKNDLNNEDLLATIFKQYDLEYKSSFLPLLQSYADKLTDIQNDMIELDGLMKCIKKSLELISRIN